MTYNHAVLGESLELSKDAAKWFAAEKERLEKSRQASKEVMDSIRPMVERIRKLIIASAKRRKQTK